MSGSLTTAETPRARMPQVIKKILRAVANYDPDYYDMYADPNESFFAQLYLARILRHLEEAGIRPPAAILEAGCQAGRLAIPLAQHGFRVTGIDRSGFALRRATQHAREAGAEAEWIQGDIVRSLQSDERRFDAVVCAEVTYQAKEYQAIVRAVAGAVRPGGLLFVSHRPRSYYVIEALRHADVAKALEVLRSSEGSFGARFHQSGYFNWQTIEELRNLYAGLGLEWVAWHPIDRLAWLCQAQLSQLADEQRAQWLELELQLSAEEAPCGRYTLVVARKPVVAPTP